MEDRHATVIKRKADIPGPSIPIPRKDRQWHGENNRSPPARTAGRTAEIATGGRSLVSRGQRAMASREPVDGDG